MFMILQFSRRCQLGSAHMGSQVPILTHVSKSQHGGKVPTFEPQATIEMWLIFISRTLIILCRIYVGLDLWKLDPTLNTSSKPHLQKMLPCKHPCHTWDLGLRAHVKWS